MCYLFICLFSCIHVIHSLGVLRECVGLFAVVLLLLAVFPHPCLILNLIRLKKNITIITTHKKKKQQCMRINLHANSLIRFPIVPMCRVWPKR